MRTYILRRIDRVERQSLRSPNPPAARPKVKQADTLSRPPLLIGLDIYSDSIAVCLAPSGSTELRPYGLIGGQHDDVFEFLRKLSAAHPGYQHKFCYEAGPHGYPLCRCLRTHG